MVQKLLQRRHSWMLFSSVWAAFLAASFAGAGLALAQGAGEKAQPPVTDDNRATVDAPAQDAAPADAAPGDVAAGAAADESRGEGRLIRVRLPLTGNADTNIIKTVRRAIQELHALPRNGDTRPVLILELDTKGGYGEGTDFTRAYKLADFLISSELTGIKTVAYVPKSIKGHGVLIALACEVIAMEPEAELGEAGIDEDSSRPIKPNIVRLYQQVAGRHKQVPLAVATGLLDPSVEVLKVDTDEATEYVLASQLDELKQNHSLVSPPETIKTAGSPGSFTGREGSKYSILLATDRTALARGLAVKENAVVADQSLVGDWRPVLVTIDGPILSRQARQLDTIITSETRDRGTNWIGVRIDSAGGQLLDCKTVADRLAGLDADVQTVAYIPVDASGGAAMVALACDQIVMQPEAQIGGKGTVDLDRKDLDAAVDAVWKPLSKKSGRSWSLMAAMIDPDLELFIYQNTQTGEVRYFSAEEARQRTDAGDWRKGEKIKPAGEVLRLTSQRAQELGVATHVVDSYDEFKQLYGFDRDPRTAKPNWALELVEALSSPGLAFVLLVIGFVGIYVELHTPGVGAGAFVAALAFMLFFWSNFLHGTAGWLEVMLFLGGIVFLLVEMLVLPGMGIFGLGGGLMILASLVLASQTFVLPQSDSELKELRHSLTIVAAATLCVVVAAVGLRRYLPHAPFFRTLLLNPPPEEDLIDLDHREALADFSHLVGRQGTAATNLMPAGKADFDGQLIDVIAEGLPIERGQSVVVTKTRGNRVMVHAMEA